MNNFGMYYHLFGMWLGEVGKLSLKRILPRKIPSFFPLFPPKQNPPIQTPLRLIPPKTNSPPEYSPLRKIPPQANSPPEKFHPRNISSFENSLDYFISNFSRSSNVMKMGSNARNSMEAPLLLKFLTPTEIDFYDFKINSRINENTNIIRAELSDNSFIRLWCVKIK